MPACKFLLGAAIASAVSVCVCAQSSSVFDMSMPTVSSPTIGNGFYIPGNPSNSIYTGPSAKASSQSTASASSSADAAGTAEDAKAEDALSSVSASDLSLLSQKGLLGQLGSLFDDRTSSYTSEYKAGSTDETNRLLKKVLARLEEIKDNDSAVSATPSDAAQASAGTHSAVTVSNASGAKSGLLRFTVNGYDVLKTCRAVYISDVQKDGTFLVTGDRRYSANGRMMNETFHILFKTKPDSADFVNYTSAAAVTQDVPNPNSFLYQLSQRTGMEASRTGNLVTMRTSDADWKLELLVDLGE